MKVVTIRNIGARYIGAAGGGLVLVIRGGDTASVDEEVGERLLRQFPKQFERVLSHGQEPAGEGLVRTGEGNEQSTKPPAAPPLALTPKPKRNMRDLRREQKGQK